MPLHTRIHPDFKFVHLNYGRAPELRSCTGLIRNMAEKQPLTNGSSYGATTKPSTPTGAHSMDLLRTSSSKNPINTSSNVLLLYRMNELQHLGRVNFGLAVGTLLYLATNVVLFTFNAMCAAASESPVPSLVEEPPVGAMAWRGYASPR